MEITVCCNQLKSFQVTLLHCLKIIIICFKLDLFSLIRKMTLCLSASHDLTDHDMTDHDMTDPAKWV